jgi:chromosome segregation ATPase
MRLISLSIEGLNDSGWSLPGLPFGDQITQLFGPNGSGKTPVIQSIAFALGYPIKFRDDIYKHCQAVVLTVSIRSSILVLKRLINESFDVEVSESTERQSFYREGDYSRYLFGKLNIPMPELTSTGNLPVQAYMSTLLPLFYVDQDHGYTSLYRAPNPFIKDQYAEMMRLIYQITPRHSFDAKKLAYAKKSRLEEVDRLIVRKAEQIERLLGDLNGVRRQRGEIDLEIVQYKDKLQQLKTSNSTKSDARSTLDALIEAQHDRLIATRREAGELQARVNGFVRIRSEIEVEINTLSLNEEARRVFASFDEVCANPSCGLFLGSSESYGKSLLYLRDQVKDLQTTSDTHQSRIASLTKDMDDARKQMFQLRENRERLETEEEVDGLVESIGAVTRKIIGLEIESQNIQQLDEEESAYVALLNERSSLQNELASLSPAGGSNDLRAIEVRTALKTSTRFWLEKLNTKNVSKDIVVDLPAFIGPEFS